MSTGHLLTRQSLGLVGATLTECQLGVFLTRELRSFLIFPNLPRAEAFYQCTTLRDNSVRNFLFN